MSVCPYLVDVERQDEPLADWRGEGLVGLGEFAGLLPHVLDVEHVVQVAVLVGDEVEHQVAVVLIRVDVVKNHQGVAVETSGHRLSCFSVDDVEQSLQRDETVESNCGSTLCDDYSQ